LLPSSGSNSHLLSFQTRYSLPTEEKCKEKREKQKDKKEGLKGPKHWVWISKPEGKDECLQYEQCKQRLINRRDFLITRYNEKDESDCKFVGGKYGSVFDWTEGRWLKAKMMVSCLSFLSSIFLSLISFLLLLLLLLLPSLFQLCLAIKMDTEDFWKSF
jgi:hypothetical protein